MRDGVYLDASLIVLLVAGLTGRAVVAKHRRLRGYTVEDYDVLTVDLDLYRAALEDGGQAAINFNHYRFPDA